MHVIHVIILSLTMCLKSCDGEEGTLPNNHVVLQTLALSRAQDTQEPGGGPQIRYKMKEVGTRENLEEG